LGIESYYGTPLFCLKTREPKGVLAVIDDKPMQDIKEVESLLKFFSHCIEVEIERERLHLDLLETNHETDLLISKLESTKNELENSLRTYSLTNLTNQRGISPEFAIEEVRLRRNKKPFQISLCDIDHFKKVNNQ
jgi:PleD family two-component response regulator